MAVLSRKERDRQLRKSDILKAAEHIFAIKGYHKATIRAIAKDAQYATGTVYLHFKDKKELYFTLFEEKIKCLLSIIEEKTKETEEPGSKLKVFVQQSLVFFEKNRDFFRIYISEEDASVTEIRFSKSPIGQEFYDYVDKLIKQAQDRGVISRDLAPEQAGDVFLAILKVIVTEWFKGEEKDLVNLSDIILRYFLNGVTSR